MKKKVKKNNPLKKVKKNNPLKKFLLKKEVTKLQLKKVVKVEKEKNNQLWKMSKVEMNKHLKKVVKNSQLRKMVKVEKNNQLWKMAKVEMNIQPKKVVKNNQPRIMIATRNDYRRSRDPAPGNWMQLPHLAILHLVVLSFNLIKPPLENPVNNKIVSFRNRLFMAQLCRRPRCQMQTTSCLHVIMHCIEHSNRIRPPFQGEVLIYRSMIHSFRLQPGGL